jgi:putative tryptophan/tyrosine transport system substrate-binding protein
MTAPRRMAVAATVTRLSLVVAVSMLAAPLGVEAQSPTKVYRLGFLGAASASADPTRVEALRAGLRDLGYVEGKNIVIEYRWAEGNYDRLRVLAAELVRLKVDVLVTAGTPAISTAKQTTTTVPIVMAGSGDAVATGLVASLARPGGNVTGLTDAVPELMAKWLELLKEAVPRTERVAVLLNPDNPADVRSRKTTETAARSLNIELHRFEVRRLSEVEDAFAAMAKSRVDALLLTTDSLFNVNVRAIAGLAVKRRLPAAGSKDFAEAGGVIGYGVAFSDNYRRAASFVDKILRDAKPADLPVEQPTKFEMVINLKTARALGLTIPPAVLVRADRVIE